MSVFERDNLLIDCWDEFNDLAGIDLRLELCERNNTEQWRLAVTSFQPEVLILGWAAPSLPEKFFDEPNCPVRYICFLVGSVRRVVPRAFIERGGIVTNWGDDAAPMVAEHALLLLLAALRKLPDWKAFMDLPPAEQLHHPVGLPTRTLFGRTVCIHGFGRIARQFIRLLTPFGVRILACSPGVPPDFIRDHGAQPVASLAELFAGAEIMVECEALTPLTRGSVNSSLIDVLARDAIFVNVGRGPVVEEAALIRRARAGEIILALDVLEIEPLPQSSPLRDLPGVIISPHIGGPTRDRLPGLGVRAVANLKVYLAGGVPPDRISTEIYERST